MPVLFPGIWDLGLNFGPGNPRVFLFPFCYVALHHRNTFSSYPKLLPTGTSIPVVARAFPLPYCLLVPSIHHIFYFLAQVPPFSFFLSFQRCPSFFFLPIFLHTYIQRQICDGITNSTDRRRTNFVNLRIL